MNFLKQIEWATNTREELIDELRGAEAALEHTRNDYDYVLSITPDSLQQQLDPLGDSTVDLIAESLRNTFAAHFPGINEEAKQDTWYSDLAGYAARTIVTRYNSLTQSYRNTANAVTRRTNRVQTLRAKLEQTPEDAVHSLSREVLEKQLSGVAMVAPGTAHLLQQEGYDPLVCWITPETKAVVNGAYNDPARGIHIPPNVSPVLPIPPTYVTLNTRSGEVSITALNNDGKVFSWSAGYDTPHPHVLNGFNPCLGDFAGPVREAVELKDLALAAELIGLFLQQINADDAAGKNWFTTLRRKFKLNDYAIPSDRYNREPIEPGSLDYAHVIYDADTQDWVLHIGPADWTPQDLPRAASA